MNAIPSARCLTGVTLGLVPTQYRRHAITETPRVRAVLDELRHELAGERVDLGELVIIGARQKLAELRTERGRHAALRRQLAQRVRERRIEVDPAAAEEVRQGGWARE